MKRQIGISLAIVFAITLAIFKVGTFTSTAYAASNNISDSAENFGIGRTSADIDADKFKFAMELNDDGSNISYYETKTAYNPGSD